MKTFSKIILLVSVVIFSAVAINAQTSSDNKVIRKNIRPGNFSSVEVNGSLNVFYTTGDPSVKIEGPESAVKAIEVKNQKGKLAITSNTKNLSLGNDMSNVRIYISSDKIKSACLNGSGSFSLNNDIEAKSFTALLNGSGAINLRGVCGTSFLGRVNGSGVIRLNGQVCVNSADFNINGSGTIIAKQKIKAVNYDVNINGSGKVETNGKVLTSQLYVLPQGSKDMYLSYDEAGDTNRLVVDSNK